MEKEPKILVIIVTYEAKDWLSVCLAPFACDREGLDVMVVDNASTDGTPDLIEALYPFVRLHRRPSNLGFGAANGIGMEYALVEGYEGVFLLNQDASISTDTIRTLVQRTRMHPEIGIASPVHRSGEGGERERGFGYYAGREELPGTDFVDLSFINAALWYLPRRTLERVGVFCPLFFHYGEDVDYCHRVRHAGLRVGYFPDLDGVHLRTSVTPSPDKRMHLVRAYHLTEYLRPDYSPLERLWRGPIMLALNGLKGEMSAHLEGAAALLRLRRTAALWHHRPPMDTAGLCRTMAVESKAPVLLLLYNRPHHTRRVLDHLMRQPEIVDTPLYILSDGARSDEESRAAVWEVRRLAEEVRGVLPHVTLWLREENVGLARNVTEGVGRVLETHDRVIVVEDDLILSPYFLRWMNDALHTYRDTPEVAHVHAGTFYTCRGLKHNHLLRFVGSWGWGTWRDRWSRYWEPDGERLLCRMESDTDARRHFDYGGFQPFTRMLRRQIMGQNDSWAVRWHASIVLHRLLSVSSNPPLVSNGGFDGSGTHSSADDRYATPVSPYPLYAPASITRTEEDEEAYRILRRYYMRTHNKVVKGWYRVKELLLRLVRSH